VDVHDYGQVMFYVGANVDPQRDVVITEGPLDHLDHAPTLQFVGGKIGIDATAKGPLEGTREWPPEIVMSEEVRELVDRRWSEYGLEDGRSVNGVPSGWVRPSSSVGSDAGHSGTTFKSDTAELRRVWAPSGGALIADWSSTGSRGAKRRNPSEFAPPVTTLTRRDPDRLNPV